MEIFLMENFFNSVFADTGAWFFFYVLGGLTGPTIAGWVKAAVANLKK
tara:strand:+ start:304 stop:447 length:144 start_codon:yes stop_codon:yes gene_type:complete